MDHFIETVRKYPCLWNTTAIEYRDQELKDAAWAEVMKETDLSSVKEVKLKWKKLRDSYRDALKRQSEMLSREPISQCKKNYPWKYTEQMQFLQPYMSNRKKPAESAAPRNGHGHGPVGAAIASGDSDSESDSERAPPPPAKLRRGLGPDRKLEYVCQPRGKRRRRTSAAASPPCETATDPLDIFFNSMCQSTKRFPFQTQIKIKRTLFEAVIDAEEALLAEQQSYASLWTCHSPSAGAAPPSSSAASSEPDVKPR